MIYGALKEYANKYETTQSERISCGIDCFYKV